MQPFFFKSPEWLPGRARRGSGASSNAGEDYTAIAAKYPKPPPVSGIVFDGDEGRLSEAAFLRDFAPDLPPAKARALFAVQWPFVRTLTTEKTTQATWRTKPSYYAVSTQDRVIDPGLQRFMTGRMNAPTVELACSHVSLLSHPVEVSNLILSATRRDWLLARCPLSTFVQRRLDVRIVGDHCQHV